jgi:hypothetical protein
MRARAAQYQQYQQEQQMRMKYKGFTPEQVQQLQQQQAVQELEMPSQEQVQQSYPQQVQPQQIQRQPIQIIPQRTPGYQKMRVPTGQSYVQPGRSVADEELDFRKWSAEKTISPNTQRILDTIRRIQNKGKTDNVEQQRRLRETRLVSRSMNIFDAHRNMVDTTMDFTGVNMNDNILGAPNIFAENGNNPNILKSNRPNILQTREVGNSLFF